MSEEAVKLEIAATKLAAGYKELRKENKHLREALQMFVSRLNPCEVTRVVTVSGPDDPRVREGAMAYRASFTNGEMEDAKALLANGDR